MRVNKIVVEEIILNGVYYDISYVRYYQLKEMLRYWEEIVRIVKNDLTNKDNKISSLKKLFNIPDDFATDIVEDILGERHLFEAGNLNVGNYNTGKRME